jgi:flagellar hook assembly protein FlgD
MKKFGAAILAIILLLAVFPSSAFAWATGMRLSLPASWADQPLFENVSITPSVISIRSDSDISVTIRFTLTRPAEIETALVSKYQSTYDARNNLFNSERQTLEPGVHEVTWNGRDVNGKIAPRGIYYVLFKSYELSGPPDEFVQAYRTGVTLTIKDSEWGIPQEKMEQIVTDASFDSSVVSPDADGVQDTVTGTFTLSEGMKHVSVYICDSMGFPTGNPRLTLENAKPGTYSFTWDGKNSGYDANGNYYGFDLYNGDYYISIYAYNDVNYTGRIMMKTSKVRLNGWMQLVVPQPLQKVRVTAGSIMLGVNPSGSGYIAVKGEEFTVLACEAEYGQYRVLISGNTTTQIPMKDVELLPQEELPAQAVTDKTTSIKDIDSSSGYARQSILNLAAKNIISGDGGGYFNPRRAISRAEMVKMLVEALDIDMSDLPDVPTFRDVPKSHWAYPYVEAAHRAGIVSGISDGLFGARQLCTREEMAAMFVRSLSTADAGVVGILDGSAGFGHVNSLEDKDKISQWAKGYVEYMLSSSLMKGTGSRTFNAKGSAERQQAAVLTDRYMGTVRS